MPVAFIEFVVLPLGARRRLLASRDLLCHARRVRPHSVAAVLMASGFSGMSESMKVLEIWHEAR